MTIYLDVVFLENLVINYIILYATGIISKAKIKKINLLLGSIIGAIYVIIYYIIDLKIYSGAIIKILLSIIIIYISFKPMRLKLLAKQILLFYLVSFVFGGATIAIIYMANSQNITIQNGMFIGNYTIKTILIGIIIAYITIIIGFNIVKTKISKKDLICDIEVMLDGKRIGTKAMIDTGNLLKEPITNLPVIIMEHTLFYDIIPKEILDNIDKILAGNFSGISDEIQKEYIHKLKVIPFSSLGKQNGMLLGFKADGAIINYHEGIKKLDKIVIGIYDKSLTKRGEYRALLGAY